MSRISIVAACSAALLLGAGCGSEKDEAPGQEAPFVPTSLALVADGDFVVGTPVQLHAMGSMEGREPQAITEGVMFTSSNEQIATVDATGLVTVLAGGDVKFEAHLGDLHASIESVRTTCVYPRFSPELQINRVMPPLAWPAKWPDGTDFEFNLANVACDLDWKETKTLAFVISAGWCTPCTLYAQRLENEVAQLNALGMEIVIIEAQDVQGDPADLAFAYSHVERITENNPAITAGDADTMRVVGDGTEPASEFFGSSSIVRAFPTVFVVRTRDMRIIADQNRADTYLPLQAIAADPEADWTNPGEPTFTNRCGDGDDEGGEPGNDTPAGAATLATGSQTGGICTDAPDFYRVDLDGAWTLQLDFEQSVGDLDVFVWDEARNQPAQRNGQVIGSSGSTSPEVFEHSGPALIAVQGFQHASAPYTITLTAGN